MTRKSPAAARSRSTKPHKQEKPIGQTGVPIGLADVVAKAGAGVYAMVCDGDCLEPVIHDKAMVLVAPGMPIRPGDFVTLWPKDPAHRPGVKRVVMAPPADWATWSPDSEAIPLVIVEQLNPPRRYHITNDKLSAIHRAFATFTPGKPEWAVLDEPTQPERREAGVAS